MDLSQRSGHGWYPYLLPYTLFLVLVEIERRAPESAGPYLLLLKVSAPLALFLSYALRGRYPELRGFRSGLGGPMRDVAFGLLLASLWIGPYVAFPALPRPEAGTGFDRQAFGTGLAGSVLLLRLLGFAVVTPFVEELFVRSFLMRFVDVADKNRDFRDVPIGQFAWRSFLVTSLWFTFSHVPWEWPVAAVAGVLFNLWLYHRRHIGSTILAHAVTNASIGLVVVMDPAWLREAAGGAPFDLWIFL
jgi:CAAX prenyl protease-like protein